MSVAPIQTSAKGVRWDLSAFYSGPSDPQIAASWAEGHRRADAFVGAYRGKVAAESMDAAAMLAAITELESMSNITSKPLLFASLLFASDTGNPKLGAFLQEQTEASSGWRTKVLFFNLELQASSPEYLDRLASDPILAPYSHYMSRVRAFAPHRLSEVEETLLEQVSNTGCRAWVRLHEELTSNHEFRFTDPRTGQTEAATQEEVLDKLRSPDRKVRSAAADALSYGLGELQRTLVFLYNTLLADKKLDDELRSYGQAEASRHLDNELDKETVDLVMGLCKTRSDIVSRYYGVKRQILGLETLTHIDRYAPLFASKRTATWDEAQQIVLDSFGSFSGAMRDRAKEFFDHSWIDAEPRAGKSGGAFCSFNTPDTHPVLLQTYLGGMDDVMTLAHEMGHGIHASLSRAQTPFNMQGSLPLAELASIFGEMLTFEQLVASSDPDEKIALYGSKIESIFATVHRQAAMFRFEQQCHEARRSKGELSAVEFGDIWQTEMQSMFGDALTLGDDHRNWWQYVGHFVFMPFYVYAYSFGELLALAVYRKAQEEGPSFADRYIDVLERGGSESPKELMARLGIDLTSGEFWLGGFRAIEDLVAEFERLWAARAASSTE